MSIKLKKKKPKRAEKELSEITGMFDRMPDHCLTCFTPFDKKDREMSASWYVVVRDLEAIVNLYCPSCWESANKFLEEASI